MSDPAQSRPRTGLLDEDTSAGIQALLVEMLSEDQGLKKSNLEHVDEFTTILFIAKTLKRRGFKRPAQTLECYCDIYRQTRLSHKGFAWEKIIEAIKGKLGDETTETVEELTSVKRK